MHAELLLELGNGVLHGLDRDRARPGVGRAVARPLARRGDHIAGDVDVVAVEPRRVGLGEHDDPVARARARQPLGEAQPCRRRHRLPFGHGVGVLAPADVDPRVHDPHGGAVVRRSRRPVGAGARRHLQRSGQVARHPGRIRSRERHLVRHLGLARGDGHLDTRVGDVGVVLCELQWNDERVGERRGQRHPEAGRGEHRRRLRVHRRDGHHRHHRRLVGDGPGAGRRNGVLPEVAQRRRARRVGHRHRIAHTRGRRKRERHLGAAHRDVARFFAGPARERHREVARVGHRGLVERLVEHERQLGMEHRTALKLRRVAVARLRPVHPVPRLHPECCAREVRVDGARADAHARAEPQRIGPDGDAVVVGVARHHPVAEHHRGRGAARCVVHRPALGGRRGAEREGELGCARHRHRGAERRGEANRLRQSVGVGVGLVHAGDARGRGDRERGDRRRAARGHRAVDLVRRQRRLCGVGEVGGGGLVGLGQRRAPKRERILGPRDAVGVGVGGLHLVGEHQRVGARAARVGRGPGGVGAGAENEGEGRAGAGDRHRAVELHRYLDVLPRPVGVRRQARGGGHLHLAGQYPELVVDDGDGVVDVVRSITPCHALPILVVNRRLSARALLHDETQRLVGLGNVVVHQGEGHVLAAHQHTAHVATARRGRDVSGCAERAEVVRGACGTRLGDDGDAKNGVPVGRKRRRRRRDVGRGRGRHQLEGLGAVVLGEGVGPLGELHHPRGVGHHHHLDLGAGVGVVAGHRPEPRGQHAARRRREGEADAAKARAQDDAHRRRGVARGDGEVLNKAARLGGPPGAGTEAPVVAGEGHEAHRHRQRIGDVAGAGQRVVNRIELARRLRAVRRDGDRARHDGAHLRMERAGGDLGVAQVVGKRHLHGELAPDVGRGEGVGARGLAGDDDGRAAHGVVAHPGVGERGRGETVRIGDGVRVRGQGLPRLGGAREGRDAGGGPVRDAELQRARWHPRPVDGVGPAVAVVGRALGVDRIGEVVGGVAHVQAKRGGLDVGELRADRDEQVARGRAAHVREDGPERVVVRAEAEPCGRERAGARYRVEAAVAHRAAGDELLDGQRSRPHHTPPRERRRIARDGARRGQAHPGGRTPADGVHRAQLERVLRVVGEGADDEAALVELVVVRIGPVGDVGPHAGGGGGVDGGAGGVAVLVLHDRGAAVVRGRLPGKRHLSVAGGGGEGGGRAGRTRDGAGRGAGAGLERGVGGVDARRPGRRRRRAGP